MPRLPLSCVGCNQLSSKLSCISCHAQWKSNCNCNCSKCNFRSILHIIFVVSRSLALACTRTQCVCAYVCMRVCVCVHATPTTTPPPPRLVQPFLNVINFLNNCRPNHFDARLICGWRCDSRKIHSFLSFTFSHSISPLSPLHPLLPALLTWLKLP